MYYLGIDVQKGQSVFHVVDDFGRKVDSGKVDTNARKFAQLVARQERGEGVEVALETGNMTFQLSRAMTEAGADVFVVDAYQNALIAKSTKKTDKQDAKMLAERIGHSEKKSAYSYGAAWHRLLKAGKAGCDFSVSRMLLEQLSEKALLVQKQIQYMESAISGFVNEHFSAQARLLRTIPGIGLLTSAALIAQAALHYLRHAKDDDPLRQWYEAIKRRKGWKKARVALARKLVSIAFGVWRHETPYDPKKAAAIPN